MSHFPMQILLFRVCSFCPTFSKFCITNTWSKILRPWFHCATFCVVRAQFHAKYVRRTCWTNIFIERFPRHVEEALHKQWQFLKHVICERVCPKCSPLLSNTNIFTQHVRRTCPAWNCANYHIIVIFINYKSKKQNEIRLLSPIVPGSTSPTQLFFL